MGLGKILLYSLAGLLLPVTALYTIYPLISSEIPSETENDIINDIVGSNVVEDSNPFSIGDTVSHFAGITSDEYLDPRSGENFFLSVVLRFEELPPEGTRQKIIAKYDSQQKPYPGWALAIAQYQTSTRPAIFWRNNKGDGRWYVFDKINLELNFWYSITLVFSKDNALQLYMHPLGPNIELREEKVPAKFLGAYDLSKVGAPKTQATLYYGERGSRQKSFRGEISQIVIGSTEELIKRKKMLEYVSEGIENSLKNIYLHITPKGQDESRFKRTVVMENGSG